LYYSPLLCRVSLPAACSARAAFSQAPLQPRVFVALLDGSVLAVAPEAPAPAAGGEGGTTTGEAKAAPARGRRLRVAWASRGEGRTPVFSAPLFLQLGPCIVSCGGSGGGGSSSSGGGDDSGSGQLLVVGHVDGAVRALRAADGTEAWRAQLQGQLFADLCAAPGLGLARLRGGGDGGGSCVLTATHGSCVYCLAATDGSQVGLG
jgi:outer membrane protein assembly factor BamB